MIRKSLIWGALMACAASGIVLATPGAGVTNNVLVALGVEENGVHEHAVRLNLPGSADDWQVRLKTQGASDFVVQDVQLVPGGFSGWHSHPGVLLATMKEGAVEWYDEDCNRHFYETGDSFTESDSPHYLRNVGTVNARLVIAYIVQRSAARRIDEAAPACAVGLGLP